VAGVRHLWPHRWHCRRGVAGIRQSIGQGVSINREMRLPAGLPGSAISGNDRCEEGAKSDGWQARNCRRSADRNLSKILWATWLTSSEGAAYIPATRRAAARCDGAPSKLLTDSGELPPTGSRGFRLRRLSGTPERGHSFASGCLTGESEERETWTAESLRAACSWGASQVGSVAVADFEKQSSCHAVGRDFGGTRFRSTPSPCGGIRVSLRGSRWDLVKRCDQPEQVLSKLESLILAQSERWRQA
jgi:hypothetical protein